MKNARGWNSKRKMRGKKEKSNEEETIHACTERLLVEINRGNIGVMFVLYFTRAPPILLM